MNTEKCFVTYGLYDTAPAINPSCDEIVIRYASFYQISATGSFLKLSEKALEIHDSAMTECSATTTETPMYCTDSPRFEINRFCCVHCRGYSAQSLYLEGSVLTTANVDYMTHLFCASYKYTSQTTSFRLLFGAYTVNNINTSDCVVTGSAAGGAFQGTSTTGNRITTARCSGQDIMYTGGRSTLDTEKISDCTLSKVNILNSLTNSYVLANNIAETVYNELVIINSGSVVTNAGGGTIKLCGTADVALVPASGVDINEMATLPGVTQIPLGMKKLKCAVAPRTAPFTVNNVKLRLRLRTHLTLHLILE